MKKLIISIGILFVGLVFGAIGLVVWAFLSAKPPTSQDIQTALNEYRQEKGIAPVAVDYELCANVADRYIKLSTIKDTAHSGLQEWADKKYEQGFTLIAEVYGPALTTELFFNKLKASEGHNRAILNPEYTLDCTYVGPEGAVIVFGDK